MGKHRKILVAIDGSIPTRSAGSPLPPSSPPCDGEMEILGVSVVDVPAEFYGEAPEAVENLVRKAEEFVAESKKRAEGAGMPAQIFAVEAEVCRGITDLAREQQADMIIMGSHGRTGLSRLLMGSVTEKVIGYAECPCSWSGIDGPRLNSMPQVIFLLFFSSLDKRLQRGIMPCFQRKEWSMFEGLFQPLHLILILLIVMIVFGPGKLPELGEGLGKSIKAFKKAMKEEEKAPAAPVEQKLGESNGTKQG